MIKKSKSQKGIHISEAWKELENISPNNVKLSQIYLDPNNPRLQTPGKQKVPDDRIVEKDIQDSYLEKLKKGDIKNLTESIRNCGFWAVDRIVLRPLKDGKFVVIEGNRRVAALKTLEEAHRKGTITLPSKIHGGIAEFGALIYQGRNPDIAWIIQGFRHSPGIKAWEHYPKAMFLAKFQKESKKSPSEISSIFDIKSPEVTHLLRSYYGFEDAKKDEEYGDGLAPEKFGHFREIIFKKDNIKTWLGWDDKKLEFKNKKNLKNYLSRSVPKEEGEEPEINISTTTRDTLSKILEPENKKILEKFEQGISFEECKKEIGEVERKREPIDVYSIIENLEYTKKTVETLPIPRLQLAEKGEEKKQRQELIKIMEELQKILNIQIKNLKEPQR